MTEHAINPAESSDTPMTHIDIAALTEHKAYGLLTNLIVPRPIAWTVSQDAQGRINCAPFSFFNMLGQSPPIIGLGIGTDAQGRPKHTLANIRATGDFVVHLVPEAMASRMNLTATEFPEGFNELEAIGLTTTPCRLVNSRRILGAPVAMECRLAHEARVGGNSVIIGQVLGVFLEDGMLDDKGHVRGHAPVGRMGTPAQYTRTHDRFELPRVPYQKWLEQTGKGG